MEGIRESKSFGYLIKLDIRVVYYDRQTYIKLIIKLEFIEGLIVSFHKCRSQGLWRHEKPFSHLSLLEKDLLLVSHYLRTFADYISVSYRFFVFKVVKDAYERREKIGKYFILLRKNRKDNEK